MASWSFLGDKGVPCRYSQKDAGNLETAYMRWETRVDMAAGKYTVDLAKMVQRSVLSIGRLSVLSH